MLAACTLGMSSCGINHSQYSEDIIPGVYEKVYQGYTLAGIRYDFQKNRCKEFEDEYKCIEDTHEYAPFCELADYVGGSYDNISEVEQYAKNRRKDLRG